MRILGPFWTVHQYDDIVATLKDLGYRDGTSLCWAGPSREKVVTASEFA
jgi:hypothetical protein